MHAALCTFGGHMTALPIVWAPGMATSVYLLSHLAGPSSNIS